jgi:hypothetical protein
MASIYDINFEQQTQGILPPSKRKPIITAYLNVFADKFQYLHDIIFTLYNLGIQSPSYNPHGTYVNGDRVIDNDIAVYEVINSAAFVPAGGGAFTRPKTNPAAWLKVTSDFRGVFERQRYNGQKLVLEYVLNTFFKIITGTNLVFRQPDSATSPTNSDIYILQNPLVNNFFIIEDADHGSPTVDGDIFSHEFIIDDNSNAAFIDRTIFVPDSGGSPHPGWWTAFNASGDGEKKIRALVDRFNIAGVIYDVQTY